MADYVVMLNTIRSNASALYQERVPLATQDNFSAVGTALLEVDADKNEFLDAFLYKVCFTEVSNRRFRNPWAVLKKRLLPPPETSAMRLASAPSLRPGTGIKEPSLNIKIISKV